MGFMISMLKQKIYMIFLNISFLLLSCAFLIIQFNSPQFLLLESSKLADTADEQSCDKFQQIRDYGAKCHHLKSHNPCVSQGYVNYLYLFYCNFGTFPFLGHSLMFLWLLVLFYVLGNTASEYFCSSLENLSGLLKLSPTIAGVTLLSLGNGAPDLFSSLVSFMGSGTCDVGFNTVIGGASFVTCVVVGTISILVREKEIKVNKNAFVRDVCCFFTVLVTLGVILIYGQFNLWISMGFFSMYMLYVIIVYSSHRFWSNNSGKHDSDLSLPILCTMGKGEVNNTQENGLEDPVSEEEMKKSWWRILLLILEMPLYLPRRLTIPVVSEEKWSKPIAVTSVILAPILLSVLWNPRPENSSLIVYGIGCLTGLTFGILAYSTTEKSNPPKKCLFPWLAGGFLMSIVWSYLTAQELVALLVSIGFIFQLSPSILALTILAWGNSVGDLITNVTMALNNNPEGAQVAISGCYAGPIFNILFGLGFSLVGSSWNQYPSPVTVPADPYLLETLIFLAASLIWALVILPSRKMKLGGVLGGGLLVIYLVAVSTRLIQTFGPLQLQDT